MGNNRFLDFFWVLLKEPPILCYNTNGKFISHYGIKNDLDELVKFFTLKIDDYVFFVFNLELLLIRRM